MSTIIAYTPLQLAIMSVPTRAPYVFSKYALRGFSEVLRYEMEAFDVKVSDDLLFGVLRK